MERAWNDCSQLHSQSCERFLSGVESQSPDLFDVQTSLAYLVTWECENGSERLREISTLPIHPKVKKMILQGPKSFEEAIAEFNPKETDERILTEVYRRLVSQTESRKTVMQVEKIWRGAKQTLGWAKLGETLLTKLTSPEDSEVHVSVAELLIGSGHKLPKSVLEDAIIQAENSKNKANFEGLMSHYLKYYSIDVQNGGRVPANQAAKNPSMNVSNEENGEFRKILKSYLGSRL